VHVDTRRQGLGHNLNTTSKRVVFQVTLPHTRITLNTCRDLHAIGPRLLLAYILLRTPWYRSLYIIHIPPHTPPLQPYRPNNQLQALLYTTQHLKVTPPSAIYSQTPADNNPHTRAHDHNTSYAHAHSSSSCYSSICTQSSSP
jgi:hypothetical protein